MPPPGTYIDITSVPFTRTVTQAEFNGGTFGGVANQVWFRFITASDVVLGFFSDKGGTFKADWTIYQSDGTTVLRTEATGSTNTSHQQKVNAGTYYIKIVRHGGGASNFNFTTHYNVLPLDGFSLPTGSIFINDDNATFPASVVTLDGILHGYLNDIPSGEIGAMLPNGISMWWDPNADVGAARTFAIVSATGALVTTVSLGLGALSQMPVIAHSRTKFYIVDRNTGDVYEILDDGTSNGVIATLDVTASNTGVRVSAAGVTLDGSILYWANGKGTTGSAIVYSHNLTTNTHLGALWTLGLGTRYQIAVTPNNHPGDLLTLPDGSMVTFYVDQTDNAYTIVQLSAAGAVLNTCVYDLDTDDFSNVNHLARINSGSDSIFVWVQNVDLTRGQFFVLTLATCAKSSLNETTHTSAGDLMVADEDLLFAPSESCTMLAFYTEAGGGGNINGTLGPIAWMEWTRRIP